MIKFISNYLAERRARRNRLVTKDGHCHIAFGSVRYSRLFILVLDFWTSLMEMHWPYVILHFIASFIFSWFMFGLLWYWAGYANGDLTWQNPSSDHVPCVINLVDMVSAFLTSIEAEMSIGYGYRLITPYCPSAITILTAEAVFGTVIICFWCGVIMAKAARPRKRIKTITFSKIAVICTRQDRLCLQLRVANLRKTLMIKSQFYGKLLRTTVTPEGEIIIMDQISVDFLVDAGKDNLFFVCPLTLYHVIDKSSPFFHMTADTLHQQQFELVVFLDGTAESTSSSFQVRTSYLPKEIMWGYQFLPIISRSKEGKFRVDFSNLSRVMPSFTPHCASGSHNAQGHCDHCTSASDNEGFQQNEFIDNSSATHM
ncbi:ATP-sensitive inward rectifier potassium channel 1-like [Electrophorus electricus]|uniref:ATP-sensitive inward rectifier potassium channel 1-like n=1 Tax=Electrophorus electricus TaxID=8005 RepID=UPI0015D0B2D7|nr:ATP-sensitive inward rectifier potassium channel 1-like [Electrophorus electricus]